MTQSVTAGAMTAIEECKHQFRNDLWSCPKNAFMKEDPHFSSISGISNNNSPPLLFNNDPTIVINDSKAKVRRRIGGKQDDQRYVGFLVTPKSGFWVTNVVYSKSIAYANFSTLKINRG